MEVYIFDLTYIFLNPKYDLGNNWGALFDVPLISDTRQLLVIR